MSTSTYCHNIKNNSNNITYNPTGIRKLFIGGLSVTTQSPDLLRYFSRFGFIEEYAVLTDRETGKSRGFGFVTFLSLQSVDAVFESAPHIIKNKKVVCKIAHPQGSIQAAEHYERQRRRIYIGDLPQFVTEEDVRDILTDRGFRPVESVEIDRDGVVEGAPLVHLPPVDGQAPPPQPLRRHRAYVTFDSEHMAKCVAVQRFFVLNGKLVEARPVGKNRSQNKSVKTNNPGQQLKNANDLRYYSQQAASKNGISESNYEECLDPIQYLVNNYNEPQYDATPDQECLLLTGLCHSFERESIQEHVAKYGQVKDFAMITNLNNNKHKGKAWLTFWDPSAALALREDEVLSIRDSCQSDSWQVAVKLVPEVMEEEISHLQPIPLHLHHRSYNRGILERISVLFGGEIPFEARVKKEMESAEREREEVVVVERDGEDADDVVHVHVADALFDRKPGC